MRRSLAYVLSFLVLTAVMLPAQQMDDPASKEDVQKLLDVMQSRKLTAAIFDVLKQQMPGMVSSLITKNLPTATAEEKDKVQIFVSNMYQKMFDSMPIEEMAAATIPIYQRHFTHADIQQLVQFYSSPIGQKVITELPRVTTEAMQAQNPLLQNWIRGRLAEIQKDAEEFARSMRHKREIPESLKHDSL